MRQHPLEPWEEAQIDDEQEREYRLSDRLAYGLLGVALLALAGWVWG